MSNRLLKIFFIFSFGFIFYKTWKIYSFEYSTDVALNNKELHSEHTSTPNYYVVKNINNARIFGELTTPNAGLNNDFYKVTSLGINQDVINNAPESNFSGVITGLLFSEDEKESLVIIDYSGKQESYTTGEFIVGNNSKILMILEDKILINERGFYKTMSFK